MDARSASRNCASRFLRWVPGLVPLALLAPLARDTRSQRCEHRRIRRNPIHLSNSPSQRSACPLIARAGAAFLFFPSPQTGSGAPRRRKLGRACEARPNHAVEAWCAPCEVRPPLGAPPWRFWAGGRASVSGIASGECVQRAPRSAGHSAWRAGSRAFRASGYEPPPRNATPRSASRTVSRNARHPSGDRNFIIS